MTPGNPARGGLVRELGRRLRDRGERLAVAESCTGGLLAARVTAVSGASDWLWGGIVAYTVDAKVRLAGLERDWLEAHGTVDADTTRALARRVRRRSGAAWGLAVTGWAGPGGGTAEDPVGTVYVAVDGPVSRLARLGFEGDRETVRAAAVDGALELALEAVGEAPSRGGPGAGKADGPAGEARGSAGEAGGVVDETDRVVDEEGGVVDEAGGGAADVPGEGR